MLNRDEQRILESFKLSPRKPSSLADIVRAGIPTTNAWSFIRSASSGLPFQTIIDIAGISRRTLDRRRGKKLMPDQSDRLVRIARIVNFAEESIGTREQALVWLNAQNQSLNGSRPIELLDTDGGAKRVETLLGRFREGSVA